LLRTHHQCSSWDSAPSSLLPSLTPFFQLVPHQTPPQGFALSVTPWNFLPMVLHMSGPSPSFKSQSTSLWKEEAFHDQLLPSHGWLSVSFCRVLSNLWEHILILYCLYLPTNCEPHRTRIWSFLISSECLISGTEPRTSDALNIFGESTHGSHWYLLRNEERGSSGTWRMNTR
jgi:hypothetical protein